MGHGCVWWEGSCTLYKCTVYTVTTQREQETTNTEYIQNRYSEKSWRGGGGRIAKTEISFLYRKIGKIKYYLLFLKSSSFRKKSYRY